MAIEEGGGHIEYERKVEWVGGVKISPELKRKMQREWDDILFKILTGDQNGNVQEHP
jgi:hypothetical protein